MKKSILKFALLLVVVGLFTTSCNKARRLVSEAKQAHAEHSDGVAFTKLDLVVAETNGPEVAEAKSLGAAWCVEAADAEGDLSKRKQLLTRALEYEPSHGAAQARLCKLAQADGVEALRTCLAKITDKEAPPDIVKPLSDAIAAYDLEAERKKLAASGSVDDWRGLIQRFPESNEAKEVRVKLVRTESLCADSDRFVTLLREAERDTRTAVQKLRQANFTSAGGVSLIYRAKGRADELERAITEVRAHAIKTDESIIQAAVIQSLSTLAQGNRMLGEELHAAVEDRDVARFNSSMLGFESVMRAAGPGFRETYRLIEADCAITEVGRAIVTGAASAASVSTPPQDVSSAIPFQSDGTPPLAVPPIVKDSQLLGYSSVLLPQFGAQMEVPEVLAAKRGPNLISTEDGRASVTFSELPPSSTLDELFADATRYDPQSDRSVTYKKKKESWFVVSGYDGPAIYYDKTVKLGGRNLRFSLAFPVKQKPDYDADIGYIANSFRQLGAPPPKPPAGLCRQSADCSRGYHCTPGGFCVVDYY